MKWFHDLPIARKLAVGFTLTTLMTVVLGVFALVRLNGANAQLGAMAGNDIPSIQHLGEVRSQLGEFRTFELAQLSMLDQPEKVADYEKRMDATAKVVRDELAAYAALPAGDKEKALYQKVSADVDTYFKANAELRAAVAAGDGVLGRQVSDDKSRPARRQLFEDLKALGAFSNTLMATKLAAANATHHTSVVAIVVCMVLLSLVAAALAFVISRVITRP
ncbi:MAG: MCP four helix bundle domain-containing protein, partial [Stenotrophomonas sp.]